MSAAQGYVKAGKQWVVDIDRKSYFEAGFLDTEPNSCQGHDSREDRQEITAE